MKPNEAAKLEQLNMIHAKCTELNQANPSDEKALRDKLEAIVNTVDRSSTIRTPVWFDYGNVEIGTNCYINHNCIFMDYGGVTIGNNVAVSVRVTFIAVDHPLNPLTLPTWEDIKIPIVIEDDVWIGADVTLLGPLRIGKGAVIGAGSVVARDVEPYTIVAGNPAKPLRKMEPGQRVRQGGPKRHP